MANFTILEPMSIGDVIDRAVRLYRRNFLALISLVAVPGVIGYLASTMFWFGYTKLALSVGPVGNEGPTAFSIIMLLGGGLLIPVWLFVWLYIISGMSRVIGDHIMLGEPITFRNGLKAARKRLGDIVLMALLFIVAIFVVYFLVAIFFIIGLMIVGFLTLISTSAGMPNWLTTSVSVLLAILAILAGFAAVLILVSRIVFFPQVVMIEGQSAGQSISRVMELGKKNWHKVGAIILFTYFVSLSLFAALTLPVMAVLYMAGILDGEFLVSPTWNIIYTSFNQLSNILTLPIWINAFTLLYFDSRVRKEAYDLELLAREVNPGFYWQPQTQTIMGYSVPGGANFGRTYVQTSPLGLGGWQPNQAARQPQPPIPPPSSPPMPSSFPGPLPVQEPYPPMPAAGPQVPESALPAGATPDVGPTERAGEQPCKQCGTALEPNASFCIRCGNRVV